MPVSGLRPACHIPCGCTTREACPAGSAGHFDEDISDHDLGLEAHIQAFEAGFAVEARHRAPHTAEATADRLRAQRRVLDAAKAKLRAQRAARSPTPTMQAPPARTDDLTMSKSKKTDRTDAPPATEQESAAALARWNTVCWRKKPDKALRRMDEAAAAPPRTEHESSAALRAASNAAWRRPSRHGR